MGALMEHILSTRVLLAVLNGLEAEARGGAPGMPCHRQLWWRARRPAHYGWYAGTGSLDSTGQSLYGLAHGKLYKGFP